MLFPDHRRQKTDRHPISPNRRRQKDKPGHHGIRRTQGRNVPDRGDMAEGRLKDEIKHVR